MRYLLVVLIAGCFFLASASDSNAQWMNRHHGGGYRDVYPNLACSGPMGSGYTGVSHLGYSGLEVPVCSLGTMVSARGYGGMTAAAYLCGPGRPVFGGTGYGYVPGGSSPPTSYGATSY